MFMFSPEKSSSSTAGSPAGVPGTLIITLGRFRWANSFLASSIVALVSLASSGETSSAACQRHQGDDRRGQEAVRPSESAQRNDQGSGYARGTSGGRGTALLRPEHKHHAYLRG